MFDLEKQIAQWRQRMIASGLKKHEVLNELETHLREQFASLMRSGMSEGEAFRTATSRLGGAESLATEFKKLKITLGATGKITLITWELAALLIAWFIAVKIFPEGKNVTLTAHIFTVTAGYLAAFVAGGFAICQLLDKTFLLPFFRGKSFADVIVVFTRIAAVLVGVALVLGIIWEKSSSGHFFAWDAKEFGGICAFVWLAGVAVMQWRGRMEEHDLMIAAIAGNLVVNLAWFGTGLMDSYLHGYGPGGHGLWWWGIALNLFCLLLGIVSRNGLGAKGLKEG